MKGLAAEAPWSAEPGIWPAVAIELAEGASADSIQAMKRFTPLALILLAFAFVLLIGWFIKHINGPRVVARAVAPDGTEMCIVQKCNWSGEPFTTSFYYRKP